MTDAHDASPCGGRVAGVLSDGDAADDARFMERALLLAERGRGRVEPNPVVGAVLVSREGELLGEGWHARYGGPHAEVEAIAAAGPRARGATLYVTLEPCAHFGKTPPCVDAVIAAGIERVVYALADPNPLARGGAERLRAAGVAVEEIGAPALAAEAARQNAPFLKRVRRALPFVTLKWAMSLDGKIATRAGDSRWISGEGSRRLVHRLRDRADAVMVGIGTALQDDPELTTRLDDGGTAGRTALRVVVDARARLPVGSRLVRTLAAGPVVVAATEAAPRERVEALRAAGVEVAIAGDGSRGVDLEALLRALARRESPRPVTNLVVEGGGRLAAALLEARLVDRIAAFVAPVVLGGAEAPTPVEGAGVERVADALRASRLRATAIEGDVLLEADLEEAPG